jgi:predicted porin
MGPGAFGLGYGRRVAAAQTGTTFGDDVKQTFIGYKYNLSKRTVVYFQNKVTDAGASAAAATTNAVGVSHAF